MLWALWAKDGATQIWSQKGPAVPDTPYFRHWTEAALIRILRSADPNWVDEQRIVLHEVILLQVLVMRVRNDRKGQ